MEYQSFGDLSMMWNLVGVGARHRTYGSWYSPVALSNKISSQPERVLALNISSSLSFLVVIVSGSYEISAFPFYYQAFCTQGISGTLVISYTHTTEKDMASVRNRWTDRIKAGKVLWWQRLCKREGRLFSHILSMGMRRLWSAI